MWFFRLRCSARVFSSTTSDNTSYEIETVNVRGRRRWGLLTSRETLLSPNAGPRFGGSPLARDHLGFPRAGH